MRSTRWIRTACPLLIALAGVGAGYACSTAVGDTPVLDATAMPLHLEDHLVSAVVTGSELSTDPPQSVQWRFDEPQPGWKAIQPTLTRAPALSATGEALRVTGNGGDMGAIYVDLPDLRLSDLGDVIVRARTTAVNLMSVGFNVNTPAESGHWTRHTPVVRDGTIQSYRLKTKTRDDWQGRVRQLGFAFFTDGAPGSIDILSVSLEPAESQFRQPAYGVRAVTNGGRIHRTLYVHAPARVVYRVRVPPDARLDAGLGVLRADGPITFRVSAQEGRSDPHVLLDELFANPEQLAQRSIDLSAFGGRTIRLSLETESTKPGTVALWTAPTLSGVRSSDKPNVIFYVIDGGAADQMSVYGYNRRTTPNLEALAREGALFEHAYSTSSWTRPSTTTFMTSLHTRALGGLSNNFEPPPVEARTMAERFHEAGYETAVFTSNPNAGSLSGLERGVDAFRDAGVDNKSHSSRELHGEFRDWRSAFPGEPYWVHFQTTDVHRPSMAQAPFAGLFAPPDRRKQLERWNSVLARWHQQNIARIVAHGNVWDYRWAATGVDRVEYNEVLRALYDETLAQQDYELGRFIERLKQSGEWERTLLVIAADHSIWAGTYDFSVPLTGTPDSLAKWAMLRSSISRVPLMFVWPGHIAGGQRFAQPVSMIDVMPTVLELAGLPQPEILQGQSLAPLLMRREGWHSRPIIFDEFTKNERTRELAGEIAMIDGRWGASLLVGAPPDTKYQRRPEFLLFDVWDDPLALRPLNDEHPDLVEHYKDLLRKQLAAHELLATRFPPGARIELTPEQLETLRALGYIR